MPINIQQIKNRLNFARDSLHAIIRGEKVRIKEPGARTWLIHQLERMHDQHYLASPSRHYYYYTGEQVPEAVTTIHPMDHRLRSNRVRMVLALGEDTEQVDILGSQIKNKSGGYQYEIPEHVRGFIAPRADIFAADEMVAILYAKIDAYEREDWDAPILKKPLVISNQRSDQREGYWSAFLKAFGISDNLEFFEQKLGVYVAPTRQLAVEMAKQHLPREITVASPPVNETHFKPGTTLFLHTTTLDKIIDHMDGFSRAGAIVRPLHLTGVIAESPEETAQSAEGNALAKSVAAQLGLAQVSDELLLKRFGITRDLAGTLVDDTYSYFKDRRVLQYFDLSGLEHKIDRERWLEEGILFPGVEIGPIINACNGPANFCKRVNEAFDAAEANLKPGDAPIDRIMVEGSAIIYQPAPPYDPLMTPEKLTGLGMPLYVVTGSQHFYFTKEPIPVDVDPRLIETYHYQVPIGQPSHERLSRAQLKDKGSMRYEPRGKADMALYYELGGNPNKETQAAPIVSNDPYNVVISAPDSAADSSFSIVDRLGQFGIFAAITHKRTVQMEDMENNVIRRADGILLMPDKPDASDIRTYSEKKFRFWSIVVAKQTDPRDMNMPVVLYDPQDSWKEEIEEYTQLYYLGALKEKPDLILKVLRSENEVVEYFKRSYETRYPPIRLEHHDEMREAIPLSGKFNVAIFCSASFENEQMLATAHNLSYNLAMSDFGIVYGGGSRYMMGEINEGVQAARNAGKKDAWIVGSNINHLVLREGKPPAGLNDYYHAPNIYKRMDYMFGTCDAAIVAPGGPGTMQELAGVMLYLSQAHPYMKGKEIVIINYPVSLSNGDGTHSTIHYFDLLTRFIPVAVRQKLNIHLANTPHEAKKKIEEIRSRSNKKSSFALDDYCDAWELKERKRRYQRPHVSL